MLSAVTSTRTSSPACRRVSPRGTMTRSLRSTATAVESRGKPRSAMSRSVAGLSPASVTSMRLARPASKLSSRTSEPTLTASSTRAVSRCGVDTDTSTPQFSLNIHSFFGLLTRATTRGTANSCLASRLMTRLSSSSPVTAATTSASAMPMTRRLLTSQASARCHSTPLGSPVFVTRVTRSSSCSMMWTSWPACCSSPAMNVPTAPPPAITTFMPPPSPRRSGEVLVDFFEVTDRHCQVYDVAVLGDQVGRGHLGGAHAAHGHRPGHAGDVDGGQGLAGPAGRHRALDHHDVGAGVDPVVLRGVGQELADRAVDRPLHRGDGRDAEALVDHRPAGVVDAGHDPLDAERLPRHAGGQDVRVVAAGDRSDGLCVADPGLLQRVAVEADAHDLLAREVLVQAPERLGVLVDHGH